MASPGHLATVRRLWTPDGLNFRQLHLNLIDGAKAPRAGVRKYCGDNSPILRCQIHKRRNIVGHFSEEDQPGWDRRLANAYDLRSYREAKAALLRIQDELKHVNPSAARSLEEGMEDTLNLQRLKVPVKLWKTLSSTNVIESAFSIVRVVCRNVKRWRPGNQIERWAAWAEARVTPSGFLMDPLMKGIHEGEKAAIVLAATLHADLLLMDDRKGAIVARDKGLRVTVTLGILELAAKDGLVNFVQAVERLRRTNFRIPESLLDALLDALLEKHAREGGNA